MILPCAVVIIDRRIRLASWNNVDSRDYEGVACVAVWFLVDDALKAVFLDDAGRDAIIQQLKVTPTHLPTQRSRHLLGTKL